MEQKTILIVDDTETNVETLLELLEDRYDILATLNGEEALEIADEEEIDLVLLDIMMPDIDGFEVCRRLKSNNKTKNIPVIFITAKTDEDSIEKAYELGGVDYITKPFRAREVLSRVSNHLSLSEKRFLLEGLVRERTIELKVANEELLNLQRDIIFTLGGIGEARSKETGNHVKRVSLFSEKLANYYGLNEEESRTLKEVSPMHDIGKIGIPDNILNKPAKLTEAEMEIIKKHATIGYEMLSLSTKHLMKMAAIVAHEHHEKWDGTGYPNRLKGEEIHIYGRITAVADVFDALGSKRVYKPAWSDDKIIALFRQERAKHFDPKLTDIFIEKFDEFREIRDELKDL